MHEFIGRRRLLREAPLRLGAAAAAAGILSHASPGAAQAVDDYPSRPVRMLVPLAPGTSTDIIARFVAEELSKRWPQRVVVENRAGGAGVIGMEAGARSAADGYTLIVGSSGTLGVNPSLIPRLPYDVERDFAPITNFTMLPLILLTHPRFEASSVAELVALARARPGDITFGSPGPGSAGHLGGELFAHRAGIRLTHVPYRGTAAALTDLLAGNIPLVSDSLASALPHVRAGRLRALGVSVSERVPQLPEVPTIAEGLRAPFDAAGWAGLVAPANTPPAIIARVNRDVVAILREPDTAQRLNALGGTPDPRSPEEYAAFIRAEIAKWGEVVRAANVRLEG